MYVGVFFDNLIEIIKRKYGIKENLCIRHIGNIA